MLWIHPFTQGDRHFMDTLLHPRRQTFYGSIPSPKETDILWIHSFTQGDRHFMDPLLHQGDRHFMDTLLHPRRQTFYGYTPSPKETDTCGYTPSPKETVILWIHSFTQGDRHLWIHPFAVTRPTIYIMLCIILQSLLCFSVSVFLLLWAVGALLHNTIQFCYVYSCTDIMIQFL